MASVIRFAKFTGIPSQNRGFGFPSHCGNRVGSTQAKFAASSMLPEPFHFAI